MKKIHCTTDPDDARIEVVTYGEGGGDLYIAIKEMSGNLASAAAIVTVDEARVLRRQLKKAIRWADPS